LVFRETGIIAVGVAVCSVIMAAVFALLGYFDRSVLLGSIIGTLMATLNFFFMVVGLSVAADRAKNQDAKGGKGMVKGSYMIRTLVMFVVLFACAKSGYFNVIALVVPLLFVRPALMVAEFFGKKGE
jgi:hypothetical protein